MYSGCYRRPVKYGSCAWMRQAERKGPEKKCGTEGLRVRVLVVEDEAAIRDVLKADLAAAGYSVDLAADGEEGLYAATEYPIDVAIIDLGLPKLSGFDLIRELRARGKTYGVLILTARDRWQDKVEGLSAGADDYVAKPFHFAEVQARLSALLRRTGGGGGRRRARRVGQRQARWRAGGTRHAYPGGERQWGDGGADEFRISHSRAPDAARRRGD